YLVQAVKSVVVVGIAEPHPDHVNGVLGSGVVWPNAMIWAVWFRHASTRRNQACLGNRPGKGTTTASRHLCRCHAHLLHPAPGLGHMLGRCVLFAVPQDVNCQHPAIRQRGWLGLRADLHAAEVISRVLPKNSTAETLADANDAVVEECAAAEAAAVVDQ